MTLWHILDGLQFTWAISKLMPPPYHANSETSHETVVHRTFRPFGAGKTTLCDLLLQHYPELCYSVSCTNA
jgi:hypothetical protein